MYPNTPTYGKRITPITQSALVHPDMSSRRNRSPKTVIANQNQSTKANKVSTSIKKLAKLKPPANSICILCYSRLPSRKVTECQQVCALAKLTGNELTNVPSPNGLSWWFANTSSGPE